MLRTLLLLHPVMAIPSGLREEGTSWEHGQELVMLPRCPGWKSDLDWLVPISIQVGKKHLLWGAAGSKAQSFSVLLDGVTCPSWPGHPLHKAQLRLLVFLLLLLLYIHIQKCQRCLICRLDVMLGLLRSWDPLKDARGRSPCCHLGSRLVGSVPSSLPRPVPASTHVFTSLCCSPRKFKPRVKFIVSISFILSIVLHFIICCDILNGACHSILTTARGYSHLLCQAFRQP